MAIMMICQYFLQYFFNLCIVLAIKDPGACIYCRYVWVDFYYCLVIRSLISQAKFAESLFMPRGFRYPAVCCGEGSFVIMLF